MHSARSPMERADWIAISQFMPLEGPPAVAPVGTNEDTLARRFANMAESKKARAKKEMSAARKAAMDAVKAASSEQEKRVAHSKLKLVRFKEVASVRTDAASRALANLENVCDTTSYQWDQEQAEKIIKELQLKFDRIVNGLRKPGALKAQREKFSL